MSLQRNQGQSNTEGHFSNKPTVTFRAARCSHYYRTISSFNRKSVVIVSLLLLLQ